MRGVTGTYRSARAVLLSLAVTILATTCGHGTGPTGRCDRAPTGVARTVTRLPFTVPAGLMPDAQLDGLPAELAVNVVRPVYARGRCPDVAARAIVLVHGRAVAGAPTFDVRADDQTGGTVSLQEALAGAGIDSYAPDLLGYGASTRFEHGLDDPCNASLRSCADPGAPFPEGCDTSANPIFPLDQQGRELGKRCAHSSRVRFGRTDVWVRDLGQVVDFAARDARPAGGKVALLGYSAGGLRVGRALDPRGPGREALGGKVDRAIFLSSIFGGPTEEPSPAPAITFPLGVARHAPPPPDPARCEGRTIPGVSEAAWEASMASDPVGRAWGVVRFPTFSTYGWNAEVAGRLEVPALVLQGLDDDRALGSPPLSGAGSACAIDDALPDGHDHVVVRVACATHAMLLEGCSGDRCAAAGTRWAGPHATVKAAVIEWVKTGTFHGHRKGSFVVDGSGVTTDAICTR